MRHLPNLKMALVNVGAGSNVEAVIERLRAAQGVEAVSLNVEVQKFTLVRVCGRNNNRGDNNERGERIGTSKDYCLWKRMRSLVESTPYRIAMVNAKKMRAAAKMDGLLPNPMKKKIVSSQTACVFSAFS